MYFLAVGSRRCDMQQPKLSGEPLSIDQLIEYLPALNEVARTQLDNWAKAAAVLHRYFGGAIEAQTMLFRTGESRAVRSKTHVTH